MTASGLLFIGATNYDRKFRAFDSAPASCCGRRRCRPRATRRRRCTKSNGKQYVVIAAGGGKSDAPSGGSYVAFALP